MALHKIRRGLDLPILGEPAPTVEVAPQPSRVAIIASDSPGMKPTMHVQPGDSVRRGQLLFEDKKTLGVRYTSPGSGVVASVNRGAKRAFLSVVVDLDDGERAGRGETQRFESDTAKHPSQLDGNQVQDLLVESGLWTAIRTRPYSKVADPATRPHSIFVDAMATGPLAPSIPPMLQGRGDDLERGLTAISKLTEGPVYVCKAPETELRVPAGRFQVEEFAGRHPAGNPGTHIHVLDPVNRQKLVWFVGIQDILAMGKLFHDGTLDVERLVSLAGPLVRRPRMVRTRLGAHLDDIVRGELEPDKEARVISGSVLSGRKAMGEIEGYLGRYDDQISVIEEGREREFLGWMGPGFNKFSTIRSFVSAAIPGKKFNFTTSKQGSDRAVVPVGGLYERVFPFDIEPAPLLRALAMHDTEQAERLGVLELDERDVALCTFVCPSKNDYGVLLRDVLTTLEKEG